MQRTWTAGDGELKGEVVFTNGTDETVKGAHLEVIPKSLASSADQIESPQEYTVVEEDPIIRFDVVVEPGERTVVNYTIKTDTEITDAQLSHLAGRGDRRAQGVPGPGQDGSRVQHRHPAERFDGRVGGHHGHGPR